MYRFCMTLNVFDSWVRSPNKYNYSTSTSSVVLGRRSHVPKSFCCAMNQNLIKSQPNTNFTLIFETNAINKLLLTAYSIPLETGFSKGICNSHLYKMLYVVLALPYTIIKERCSKPVFREEATRELLCAFLGLVQDRRRDEQSIVRFASCRAILRQIH